MSMDRAEVLINAAQEHLQALRTRLASAEDKDHESRIVKLEAQVAAVEYTINRMLNAEAEWEREAI